MTRAQTQQSGFWAMGDDLGDSTEVQAAADRRAALVARLGEAAVVAREAADATSAVLRGEYREDGYEIDDPEAPTPRDDD